jgi:PIN domain nuclease of toxin-antitoxin system
MIVLDTHIWVWWVHGDPRLTEIQTKFIEEHEGDGLGVSIILCWEVAKLVERGCLVLPCQVSDWLDQSLRYPGIELLDLTTPIVVDSTQLPSGFPRRPDDCSHGAYLRLSSTDGRPEDPFLSPRNDTDVDGKES